MGGDLQILAPKIATLWTLFLVKVGWHICVSILPFLFVLFLFVFAFSGSCNLQLHV